MYQHPPWCPAACARHLPTPLALSVQSSSPPFPASSTQTAVSCHSLPTTPNPAPFTMASIVPLSENFILVCFVAFVHDYGLLVSSSWSVSSIYQVSVQLISLSHCFIFFSASLIYNCHVNISVFHHVSYLYFSFLSIDHTACNPVASV